MAEMSLVASIVLFLFTVSVYEFTPLTPMLSHFQSIPICMFIFNQIIFGFRNLPAIRVGER